MRQLVVGLAITLVVTVGGALLLDQPWWAAAVMGAVLALALWVMLWIGDAVRLGRLETRVSPMVYATGGVIGSVLGLLLAAVADNAAFVSVGFVAAGVLAPAARAAQGGARDGA